MTFPALINNTQDKQFKTAFKKQYSAFAQAMQRAYVKDGQAYEIVDWQKMPRYFCTIQKQMKVTKYGIDCDKVLSVGFTDNSDWPKTGLKLWHKNGEWFDKKGNPQYLNDGYTPLAYVLPDGGLVNYNCTNQIFIDVNGYKKPNTIGKDIFFFTIQSKQLIPTIVPLDKSVIPNGCSMVSTTSTPTLTKENYEDDCYNGSGWGCSVLYLLE